MDQGERRQEDYTQYGVTVTARQVKELAVMAKSRWLLCCTCFLYWGADDFVNFFNSSSRLSCSIEASRVPSLSKALQVFLT